MIKLSKESVLKMVDGSRCQVILSKIKDWDSVYFDPDSKEIKVILVSNFGTEVVAFSIPIKRFI